MMQDSKEMQPTYSEMMFPAEDHAGALAVDQDGDETSSLAADRPGGLSAAVHACSSTKHTAAVNAQLGRKTQVLSRNHQSSSLSSTPTRCPRGRSLTGPPGPACTVAPCARLSHFNRPEVPSLQRGTWACTAVGRDKTDTSPAVQGEPALPSSIGFAESASREHVKTGPTQADAGLAAKAERNEAGRTTGACHGLRSCKDVSSFATRNAVIESRSQTPRGTTANSSGLAHETQHQALRKEDPSTREDYATAQHSSKDLLASIQHVRVTGRSGSVPPVSRMRKSYSTVALSSSKLKVIGAAQGGLTGYLADPSAYSRLPPEVWVYKSPECSAEGSSNAKGEEDSHKRSTLDLLESPVVASNKTRASMEAGSFASQSKRNSPLNGKRLVFPLEKPDGHQQADFLCDCIPALLELNDVPSLFSLKHSIRAIEPAISAFPLQASDRMISLKAIDASVTGTPAENPCAPNTAGLDIYKSKDSRRVTLRTESPGPRARANAKSDASAETAHAPDISTSKRLSRGLQAAHDARILSEWWGGLMNVVDVTLSELCRQLKTFAPFHAKCLEVLHQLLMDYAHVHQETQAKQAAQLHTSLLEAHAEHAVLRKEIVSLKHKVDKLQSKAHEADELRRLLDIHVQLFSLQEIEVLAAQEDEEDALRAEFQWHKLLDAVNAVKYGRDSTSFADVWVSGSTSELHDPEVAEHPHQFLSVVLPSVVTLLPHETIVKGVLDSPAHGRLFQIHIPPGRWSVGIAITCSQPVDISLLLLLASAHDLNKETEEQRCEFDRETTLYERKPMEGTSPRNEQTSRLGAHHRVQSTVRGVLSSPAPCVLSHKGPSSSQNEIVHAPAEGSDVLDVPMGALQIGSFASFRISPGEPQILQVRMPASGSPNGGWLLMRLQGALCTRTYLARKLVESRQNPPDTSACSSTRRSRDAGPRASSRAPPPQSSPDTEAEAQNLQVIGTAGRIAQISQGSNNVDCPDKLEGTDADKGGVRLKTGKRLKPKTGTLLSWEHDYVYLHTSSGETQVRYSVTVHSEFLHEYVDTRAKRSFSDFTGAIAAHNKECQQHKPVAVPETDDPFSTTRECSVALRASAHLCASPRSRSSRPLHQYGRPPRLVLRREANTQTITSKLFRGFVRRLHEGPRPPPVPQFCVCDIEKGGVPSTSAESSCDDQLQCRDGAMGSVPDLQFDLKPPGTFAEAASNRQTVTQQMASLSAQATHTGGEKPPASAADLRNVELTQTPSDGTLDKCKQMYYSAPSFPILKLLLDETPAALGDFTALLHQNHFLRDAAGAPTAFKGSNFVRWPPRLLAETVWIILVQQTRARMHTKTKNVAEQHVRLPPTRLHTKDLPVVLRTTAGAAAPSSLEGASTRTEAPSTGAAWQENDSGKPDVLCLAECDEMRESSAAKVSARDSSATTHEHTQDCGDSSCESDDSCAKSLAAFAFNYFLRRLDVAFIAHSVAHSFLLSILYWAPELETIAQEPPQSGGIKHLHRPLIHSGSITLDESAQAGGSGNAFRNKKDSEGGQEPVETLRDLEVRRATSKARGFTPWFAVRLFGRITGLLSSFRDTQLFRRSLNDFVCLSIQALLEEVTGGPPPGMRRDRSLSKGTEVSDDLKRISASCGPALSRVPSSASLCRGRDSVTHSLGEHERLSIPFIPPRHLQVPSELCLAVTHRAAARIGVRIFSEEGTSEYRAAVLEAIAHSKEAALASFRLPRQLSRWAHVQTVQEGPNAQQETSRPDARPGGRSSLHPTCSLENRSIRPDRSSVSFAGQEASGVSACGPPDVDERFSARTSFHSGDTSWDLPMPVDLLVQIMTQQWEVLYLHLQQAMELVLDETDEKLLKPLTSLSGFSSFARRLNPYGISTPEELLRLYYDTLSTTSSRLQPFCSSLSSAALSALLLHQPRLLDFPVPIPPSPFLTLAPHTSVAPRSRCAHTSLHMKKNALPLWPIHTRRVPPSTGAATSTALQGHSDSPPKGHSITSNRGYTGLQIISSASHEFRLAAFIVEGLTAFIRAERDMCNCVLEEPPCCIDRHSSASIACQTPMPLVQRGGKAVSASSPQKKSRQKRIGTLDSFKASTEELVASTDASVRRPLSLGRAGSPCAVVASCLTKGPAADTREAGNVSREVRALQESPSRQPIDQETEAGGSSHMLLNPSNDDAKVPPPPGRKPSVRDQALEDETQQASFPGRTISSQQTAIVTEVDSLRHFHHKDVGVGFPRKSMGLAVYTTPGPNHDSSQAALDHLPFQQDSPAGTRTGFSLGSQASGHTQQFSAVSPMPYIDIVLDRRVALETARDIEAAAVAEAAPAGSLLERLHFFLKALLLVFNNTDLPEMGADELSPEAEEGGFILGTQGDVIRSLEGFMPSRGRLSPQKKTDREEQQTLSSTDVVTAQVLLRSIWNTIYEISARIAEDCEQRKNFQHLFALQRIQCPAAVREALGELARLYRDQVDRLLIHSLGCEGVSAIMEQPELRDQLLRMHQSVADLEEQQQCLQKVFTSAVGKNPPADEERSRETIKSPQVKTTVNSEDAIEEFGQTGVTGRKCKSYSEGSALCKQRSFSGAGRQRQNKSVI